jgi:hypothetical protein
MKTSSFILALCALITLGACSKQESNRTETLSTSLEPALVWQTSVLGTSFFENQQKVSHYNFDKNAIQQALKDTEVKNFRFVLGLKNDQIEVNMLAVDNQGTTIAAVASTTFSDSGNYQSAINGLKNNAFSYSKARLTTPVVGPHLLSYQATFNYVDQWNKALASQNIEDMISYSGVRYRHYSLEQEVIRDMIADANAESIALFWGLNTNNELTTVLFKKDRNNNLILNTNSNSNSESYVTNGDILDFTTPCPTTCDE